LLPGPVAFLRGAPVRPRPGDPATSPARRTARPSAPRRHLLEAPRAPPVRCAHPLSRHPVVDDPRPGTPGWWLAGNWLLDGFSRPDGFGPRDTRAGSFGLQLYGGGRVRWTFADAEVTPADSVIGVQAWPASAAPSLLDGRWHHVACVRRWNATTAGATLELWVDGVRTATAESPRRTDMRRWWDRPPHPRTPAPLGGWSWGSEVMTAWGMYFAQYEDYKGLVDELRFWDRAKTPAELRDRWRAAVTASDPGLVGWFPLDEGRGYAAHDRLDSARVLRLQGSAPGSPTGSWSADHAPLAAGSSPQAPTRRGPAR
jgi:hypothetical protein